ncbi:MAG: acyl carrier protein [Alphaproteobacteria bacterium]|nr:acyl carrier protein [Alphaproteobacteria bacterium]
MTTDKNEIRATVLKYLARAVDQVDPATVDSSRSMKELGANSIDIVEVVSSSMRELRIKVPRAQLNDLANIDELVDLLHRTALEKASS